MKRDYFSSTINDFLILPTEEILKTLLLNNEFARLETTQKMAWTEEIEILKKSLQNHEGLVLFEYSIPRMGKRIDVVLIIKNVIFILEFKIGEKEYLLSAIDQVWDYALDLKNFHETSHLPCIAPILIATDSPSTISFVQRTSHNDDLLFPITCNAELLRDAIQKVLEFSDGAKIDISKWIDGKYAPTPTIIEAAMALYNNHTVTNIIRHDAVNLEETSNELSDIIEQAKNNNRKVICFVTGVPGAGKTLVGLDIATKHLDREKKTTSVFLSGNGPLVLVLREALTRDKIRRIKEEGGKIKKGTVAREVKLFIQNVHNFRDECLTDINNPPFDHVAIFDEAQRAWNLQQTASFMKRKKNVPGFVLSEPEFLISCLDRHKDWAVIICLVGGGQEINTGEAGIGEWIDSLNRSFPKWQVYISSRLTDSEYAAGNALKSIEKREDVVWNDNLHLAVSLRSFRAEKLSLLVKCILDINTEESKIIYNSIKLKYPIVLTRSLAKAKKWLKEKARASERFGIVVSSNAQRLKPHAIDVKAPINPIHWFLNGKEDVRSSYYLEDVATEFHIQGLELDWACVTWDADFRYTANGWGNYSFVGDKWHNVKKEERKQYLKNAYRVLLTRARQGMVIVVPEGDSEDLTRKPEYYDSTYNYLKDIITEVL